MFDIETVVIALQVTPELAKDQINKHPALVFFAAIEKIIILQKTIKEKI
jgi:hypothetical protein